MKMALQFDVKFGGLEDVCLKMACTMLKVTRV